MSYRIIDQALAAITGTESIPGTQQTDIGETTPLNVRWTWNTALAWILGSYLVKLGSIGSTYSGSIVCSNKTLKYIHIKYGSGSDTVKIGTTDGGDDILNETEAITDDIVKVIAEPCFNKTIYVRLTGNPLGRLNITLEFSPTLF
jgi:hypothetical protein